MSSVTHCKLEDLKQAIAQPCSHLFVSASYEERAYGVWQQLRQSITGKRVICFNDNHIEYLQESVAHFQSQDPQSELVRLDSDQPVKTFNALRRAIESLRSEGPCRIAIDVSCFTREAMCILLFLAKHQLPRGSSVTVIYHKAAAYGRAIGGGWLSQGVREVRTILGYAGLVRLSTDAHLIILPGYEFERAQQIIDAVQPARITLGKVAPEKSVAPHLNEAMLDFLSRLESLSYGLPVERFDFSSVDPFETRDSVLKIADSSYGNIVVACLNTKPATVGTCLAALQEPRIQLIYAQPLCYNIAGYSKPSGEVLFFEIPVD